MPEHLTVADVTMLMQGLDALTAKDATELFTTALLGAAMAGSKEEAMENVTKEQQAYRAREATRIQLHEKIILLKAKLLRLRDEAMLRENGISPEVKVG